MSVKAQSSYHHGDLKQALVKEALTIIAEDGAAGLSLRDLARRVGVTQTAPYRHFEDRDALLATVAEEGFRLLKERLEANGDECAIATTDTSNPIRQIGERYIDFAIKNPSHYRVMFGPFVSSAKRDKKFPGLIDTAEALHGHLISIIEVGQSLGLFREGPAVEIADSTWSLMHGLATLIIDKHISEDGHGATTNLALDIWWRAICKDEA
jgi:AcrR family transcriptional regulator